MPGQSQPKITIRNWVEDDIPALVKLHATVYSFLYAKEDLYTERKYGLQFRSFPEGQFLAEVDGQIVAYATSLILQLDDEEEYFRYIELSGGGSFSTHKPGGDTLYGADIAVHPDYRGLGIAGKLYTARKKLLTRLNLRRMVAYGRIPGYSDHKEHLTAEEYVQQVVDKKLSDPALNAHLKAGYQVKRVIFDYIHDAESLDYCTYLEYENPKYKSNQLTISAAGNRRSVRRIRICSSQYMMRPIKAWSDLEATVKFFVETADEYHSHFLVMPEYFTAQMFSTMSPKLAPLAAVKKLAALEPQYLDMFTRFATQHQLYIIGGSTPVLRPDGHIYNVAHLFTPNGSHYTQDKLHITHWERDMWHIHPGSGLKVFRTPLGRIAIQICYDIEFPELTRLLALAGAEVIFVPISTDEKKAYNRVRYSAFARATENYIYTVISGSVGNLPDTHYSLNYSQSVIITPSDFAFPTHSVEAEADPNVESVAIGELSLLNLAKQREVGSISPLLDRRTDLFELKAKIPVEIITC